MARNVNTGSQEQPKSFLVKSRPRADVSDPAQDLWQQLSTVVSN